MYSKLFLILLLFPVLLTASVQWQENGVPVRQAENMTSLNTLSLSDGSFVNVWSDSRDGEQGIYAQRINQQGEKMWVDEGIEVIKTDHMQYLQNVIISSDDGVIVCWRDVWDYPDHVDDYYIQKIDENGNLLWDSNGIIIDTEGYINPKILPAEEGAFFLVFYNYTMHEIRAMKFSENGSLAEGWENIIIFDTYHSNYEICSDLSGGFLVSFISIYEDVYIQRVDDSGAKLWGELGILLHNGFESYDIRKLNLLAANSEDFRISWSYVNDDNSILGLCMESIDSSGQTNWSTPAEFTCDNIYKFSVTLLEDSSTMIIWNDNYNLLMNKIDSEGNPLWENTIIAESQSDYLNFSEKNVSLDSDENTVFIWEERIDNINRLYLQKLDDEGNFLLPEQSTPIFQTEKWGTQYILNITSDKYYIAWNSLQVNQQNLKHQIMDYAGNIQLTDMGETFYSGISGSCSDLVILDNGDNPVVLWRDRQYFTSDQIFLQILNSDGSPQFVENGIPITSYTGYDQNHFAAAIGKNSEIIATIWSSEDDSFNGVSIQGIDQSGNYVWSDDTGILLDLSGSYTQDPKISCYDNNGIDEFYTGWNSWGTNWFFNILAQKVIAGIPQWDAPVMLAENENSDCLLLDIKDKFYIWEEGLWGEPELWIKLLDDNGNSADGWPIEGIQIAEYNYQNYFTQTSLIDEGIFITWFNTDSIYGQIIDYDGNTVWEDGGKLLVSEDSMEGSTHLVIDDYIYINWVDLSDNERNQFVQRFDFEGNSLWPEPVQTSFGNQLYAKAVLSAVENDVLIVWEHSNSYSDESMLKAQLVSPEGELAYEEDGLLVTDAFKRQNDQVVYSSGSEAYIAWMDGRSTYISEGISSYCNIYAQKLQLDPTNFPNDVVDAGQLTLSNYPNPFNPTTTILYSLAEGTNVELSIFNIKGQKVKTLVKEELEMGNHSTIWDGTDDKKKSVSSGIYMYKLKTENQEVVKRMILLK